MKCIIALCLFGLAYSANPICQLKPEEGLCRGFFPSYYYDEEFGQCMEFIYGGCGGNKNRFETEEECMETCGVQETNEATCHLVPETGMCLGYFPRYYYNAKERKCEKFIYGGCQGNPNNFNTLEECEAKCGIALSTVPVCQQDPEPGNCMGNFPRYYYDKIHGECKSFIYGGCGGNDNKFETKTECEEFCQVIESESVCELKAETGPCRARFLRYHFNKDSGKCEIFVYGGCKGNGNNFQSKEECEQQCATQSAVTVCEQEKKMGPCRGYFPRYFFNKRTGLCERFIYGGCQSNENNFESVEECEQTCRGY